jgi:hypothetical protein
MRPGAPLLRAWRLAAARAWKRAVDEGRVAAHGRASKLSEKNSHLIANPRAALSLASSVRCLACNKHLFLLRKGHRAL